MVAKKEENSNMEKREKRLADEEKVEDVKAEKLIIFLIFFGYRYLLGSWRDFCALRVACNV